MLALLLLLALVPPLVAQAAGQTVGSFAMFSAVQRYRLELAVRSPGGVRQVPLRRLAPHLSRDARRIILPAASGAFGRDQANILAGGLDDIVRLVCRLEPDASSARATLLRGPPRSQQLSPTELELECSALR